MPEARTLMREAKDRLSEASYRVGFFYYRVEVVSGRDRSLPASARTTTRSSRSRDAVYYHLAESLLRSEKKAEALPYFERLLKEFEQSSYLEAPRRRVDELKSAPVPER